MIAIASTMYLDQRKKISHFIFTTTSIYTIILCALVQLLFLFCFISFKESRIRNDLTFVLGNYYL